MANDSTPKIGLGFGLWSNFFHTPFPSSTRYTTLSLSAQLILLLLQEVSHCVAEVIRVDSGIVGANNTRIIHSAYLRGSAKFVVLALNNGKTKEEVWTHYKTFRYRK